MHLRVNDRPFASLPVPISETGAYRPISYWHETVDIQPGNPLVQEIDCDVAIVGGGFTGLSTAYELKRGDPALKVILMERTVVGHGASGRNGGFVMPLLGWDLVDATKKLGERGAADAYRLMYDAVAHLKQLVEIERIDCDLESTGYLLLATCSKRAARMRRECALAHDMGFSHQWLEGEQLRAHIRSPHFKVGLFDPMPAILNPAKLARGLLGLVRNLGVEVYEQTPLVELTDGDEITLVTSGGKVRAKCVVLAVNGYGASLGFLPARVLPVHTYIVLTEPVADEALDTIGWASKRASLETARNFIHYFRLTADNRILFGGEDAELFYQGRYQDNHPRIFRALRARFRDYFPTLGHVKFTHAWGGVLGVTLDMFPTFGVGGARGNIFHAAGYSGHGVALGNYAGRILAPRILDRLGSKKAPASHSDPFFFGRFPLPVPPEPIRYLGMQAYRVALRLQDRLDGA